MQNTLYINRKCICSYHIQAALTWCEGPINIYVTIQYTRYERTICKKTSLNIMKGKGFFIEKMKDFYSERFFFFLRIIQFKKPVRQRQSLKMLPQKKKLKRKKAEAKTTRNILSSRATAVSVRGN
jgi:hypothetical protein